METVTHALRWFEIPVVDFERAKGFYSTIFEFEMPHRQMGPRLMGFLPFDMGKGVGGAIVQGEGFVPAEAGSLVYLNGGADLSVVLDRVEAAGGRVLLGKTQIGPQLGFFATFLDPEGNRVALHSMA